MLGFHLASLDLGNVDDGLSLWKSTRYEITTSIAPTWSANTTFGQASLCPLEQIIVGQTVKLEDFKIAKTL